MSGRLQLRSSYARLSRLKSLAALQVRHGLASTTERSSPKLWDSVGCNSKHPILLCKTIKSNVTHFDVPASLDDFEDSVYLNSTVHNSCSLVGSSGNLKNHAYGKLIDSKSIVIRINNPPMNGYEEFVGYRPADILMINNHLSREKCHLPTNDSTLYVSTPFNGIRNGTQTIRLCNAHLKAKILGLSSYIIRISQELLEVYAQRYNLSRGIHGPQYIRPTSGFKALLFSMLVCRRVHMFGFGMQGAITFHYYSNDTVFRPPHHEVDLEMTIYKDIERRTLDSDIMDLEDEVFGQVTIHH